ncbi:toxin HipA [Acidihalobacter aeolianus]|uniref:Toxin HipA n=1 Tax=Acidihalobacter aeolianus TaxID=2792603 RepID=A0A1D8K540_9GAMM|nr:type II toxin-antitoxin system HipA family toxin [Acidihalobacter aeolianus]AOV16077.1 toxin HipA [Acidihalobacter aeolianus]
MARRSTHAPLRVLLNNHLVGHLSKTPDGAIRFNYDQSWLDWEKALPVSLSLPLREDAYRGKPVIAVFDNLLPDADALRRRIAEKVGAAGTDAYSMLAAIGRDCVGALQFIVDNDNDGGVDGVSAISGEQVDDSAIENLLKGLAQAPLGLDRDDTFRISVSGAQEKTALLMHKGQWLKPHGTTPTTHILKKQIGRLPNGVDLSNSVENEFYCLKLIEAFDLQVNRAEMRNFGETKALVIERFDRRWTSDGRLLRLPQEDFCQALSVPPTRKYQSEGGPGLADVIKLLEGSDYPTKDQITVFKAQILFWLIGATDGHAKNFSIFLGRGGSFRLTPIYDVLTAQPSLISRQIEIKQMRLAMALGTRNHYKIKEIQYRHFLQSGDMAGLSKKIVQDVIEEIIVSAKTALEKVENELSEDFPEEIHSVIKDTVKARLRVLTAQ